MRKWMKGRHRDDWNRRRKWNYERERALQAFRSLLLFLFVAMFLGLALAGSQERLRIPESLWSFVTLFCPSRIWTTAGVGLF
jgi:hypothetical protein